MSDLVEFISAPPPPFSNDVADALRLSIQSTLQDAFEVTTQMDAWSVRKAPLELNSFVVCTIDMKQDENLCSTFKNDAEQKWLLLYDEYSCRPKR